MAQFNRAVDVQFSGELLPQLIKSLKTFTQTAHIVFGQHDLAVIGAEDDDNATVGPSGLICFRVSRHAADHYHVDAKRNDDDDQSSEGEEDDDDEDDGDDEDDEDDASLAHSVVVSVDYSAILSATTGKNYRGAVLRMKIERDDPYSLIVILKSRSGEKKTTLNLHDPSISPISMRHDYPPHSARSIVGEKLHNTVANIADNHTNCGITYEKDMIIFSGLKKKSQHSSVKSTADTLHVANTPPEANSFKAQGEFNAKKLSTFTKNFKLGERINMYLNDGLPLVLEILFPNYDTMEVSKPRKKSVSVVKLEDEMNALTLQDEGAAVSKKYEPCEECQVHLGVPLADTPSYLGYIRYSLRGIPKAVD